MADDANITITTTVDTSQLEASMKLAQEATGQFTQSATLGFNTVAQAEAALADAQKQLGAAAAAGNAQAVAVIKEYQSAVEVLKSAVAEETAAVADNTAAQDSNNSSVGAGIRQRAASIASVRELGAVLSGGGIGSLTSGLARVAGSSTALAPILSAAFPVIGAIALIDILSQIPVQIAKMQDAIAGWDADQKRIFEDSIKEAQTLQNTYEGLASRQAEAFGKTAVSNFQQELARTQEEVNKLTENLNKAGQTAVTSFSVGRQGPIRVAVPEFDIASMRDQVQKNLDQFNALIKQEAESKHLQIPSPIEINWDASNASVREQLQKLTDRMRSEGERMAAEQAKITEDAVDAAAKAANEAQRRAQREQQHAQEELKKQELRAEQQAQKEEIAAFIASIETEVQGTKQGSQERIEIIRGELAVIDVLYGQQSTEYQKMLGKLAEADKERTAELQRQTTQQLEDQLKAIREQAAAQEKATLDNIREKQKGLDEQDRLMQQELSNQARDEGRGGLFDLGKVQASLAQIKAAEQQHTNESIALAKQAADAKIAALERVVEAAEVAALADPAASAKFMQDAQAAADKQVAIEAELQAKLKELRRKGADDAQKIDDQLAQYKEQETQRIAGRMMQFEDQALFHSKSFGQAVLDIYRGMAESIINTVLQMANRWIAEHIVMEVATRLFHLHNTAANAQASAQQSAQTITANVSQVTSEAAVAAAKAYAAYAEFPPVAAAMAAAAEAAVLSFMPEAAAAGGFDVPMGVSPITQLHPEEMVLPRDLANSVRNMTRLQGEFSGPGTVNNTSGGDFHFHAGDVNAQALDKNGMSDIFRNHQRDIAKAITRMAKAGEFTRSRR